jgi:hypothetical protein
MRIIAFIQDEHSIKDIIIAQGISDFQAPPPIPKEARQKHASAWFCLTYLAERYEPMKTQGHGKRLA